MPEETTLNRRYIAIIALIAASIIAVGLVAKISFVRDDAPPTTPLSEASALQQLSRENELSEIAAVINERVTASAAFVTRVGDSTTASAVAWTSRDSLITTSTDFLVKKIARPPGDSAATQTAIDTASVATSWLVVVARDARNRVVSWNGIGGGVARSSCGPRQLDRILIDVTQAPEFEGAGVFDLNGRVAGLVVNCGSGRLLAIPASEIGRLLSDMIPVRPDSARDSAHTRDSFTTKR